jgi:hypothetical protein
MAIHGVEIVVSERALFGFVCAYRCSTTLDEQPELGALVHERAEPPRADELLHFLNDVDVQRDRFLDLGHGLILLEEDSREGLNLPMSFEARSGPTTISRWCPSARDR